MQRLTHIFEQEVTPLLSDFKTDGKKLFTVPKGLLTLNFSKNILEREYHRNYGHT